MKYIGRSLYISFSIAFLLACTSTGISWQHDGLIISGGVEYRTKFDNVYTTLLTDEGIHLAGYTIDKEGNNFPLSAFFDKQLKEINYWPHETPVNGFFKFKQQYFSLNENGKVRKFEGHYWKDASFNLEMDSVVIYSKHFIIACIPAPLFKNSSKGGFCYSPEKKWKINFNWRTVPPSICNNKLVVVEEKNSKIIAHQLEMNNGREISILVLDKVEGDICQLFK